MKKNARFVYSLSIPEPFSWNKYHSSILNGHSLKKPNRPETVMVRTFDGFIIMVRARQNATRAPPKKTTINKSRYISQGGTTQYPIWLTECQAIFLFEAKNPADRTIGIGEASKTVSAWLYGVYKSSFSQAIDRPDCAIGVFDLGTKCIFLF